MAIIYLVFSEFLLQIEINNPTAYKSFRFMLYFTVIIYFLTALIFDQERKIPMNWQTGILTAALFASLCGCCIQAALTHNWKLINLFYWGSVLLIFVLASLFY